ncbi:anaphase-promoting complex subunit 4 [Achaetomium macrosporum]|uniref:Anaphase-promoting complex subunit 4 n=1 Tax=Achaetomium macrosporum TaxID=79813 RepID=A0AAN7C5U2_9PEZI|nr:anaphase-promoting complex subunit 4 [Achaetomium macrosporum]
MTAPDSLPKLQLFGSTALSSPVTGGHIACNPAIDLTATVGEADTTLYVWRAGDQLVSKHVERGKRVEAVRWKEDGQFLAAGWSDGVVRLMGLESSKTVHHIRVCEAVQAASASKIKFIAWSRNVTGEGRWRRREGKSRRREKGILLDADRTSDVVVDLPHELTFLEVETALPKLSPLPVSGGSGDDMFLFSTTASLEFVFRPCKAEDADDVHVMVVGTADGGIHLSIYDSFVIGTLKHSPRRDGVFQLCGHSSHPEASTHMLLLRPQAWDRMALYLVPMDLKFLHQSPVNLSLLASRTTTLQNLIRYLKQTQSHMATEWKSTRELPGKFMLAVQDDLKKMPGGDMTVVQALYHTVVTGHVFPAVKEWLVDSLAERGHKRWEKAVVSGLTGLRSLVHENFIPALERCGVVLSRLLGIARFHESEEKIGFDEAQINKLMDIVSCLMLVAHKVLTTVMDELEHFNAFSTWLRFEIDKQASSSVSEEITETEATMDYAKVLVYIQHYMTSSPLALYFDEAAKEDYIKDQEMVEPGPSLLDLLDKQLHEQEAGRPYMKVLPRVGFLVNYLTSRANTVFQGIAEAEKQGVHFGQATEVTIGRKIWKHELQMSRPKRKIYIIGSDVPLENSVGRPISTTACGLGLPEGVSVVDFKFLDDKSLLILCGRSGMFQTRSEAASWADKHADEPRSVLLRVAYQSAHLRYEKYTAGQCPSVLALGEEVGVYFAFSRISGFTPVQMEVQRASNLRGEIPARVCLLARDRAMYRTYVLPEDLSEDPQQL